MKGRLLALLIVGILVVPYAGVSSGLGLGVSSPSGVPAGEPHLANVLGSGQSINATSGPISWMDNGTFTYQKTSNASMTIQFYVSNPVRFSGTVRDPSGKVTPMNLTRGPGSMVIISFFAGVSSPAGSYTVTNFLRSGSATSHVWGMVTYGGLQFPSPPPALKVS